jgi:putative flippase GtrA
VSLPVLVCRYTIFAVVATLANLAVQRVVLSYDASSRGFALAVAAGTAAGLLIKYLLDKRWIFNDVSSGARSHGRKFTLYTVMGIITTMVFWGTETGFWLLWRTEFMRELGAILGLCIGYFIKYKLDRRYVFTDSRLDLRTLA